MEVVKLRATIIRRLPLQSPLTPSSISCAALTSEPCLIASKGRTSYADTFSLAVALTKLRKV